MKMHNMLAAAASSLLMGCSPAQPIQPEYVLVKGTVFGERYTPKVNGLNSSPSQYYFSFDTNMGRKLVDVKDALLQRGNNRVVELPKEGIDALVGPGTMVEIELWKGLEKEPVYTVLASQIKVLGH